MHTFVFNLYKDGRKCQAPAASVACLWCERALAEVAGVSVGPIKLSEPLDSTNPSTGL